MTASGPLSGKKILVTRGGREGEQLATQIRSLGGKAVVVPMIGFQAYMDPNAPLYLQKLQQYSWIIFTSKNGVKYFLQSCRSNGIKCEKLSKNWAAVGKKTAAYMESCGLRPSFTPDRFTAKDFAAQFLAEQRVDGLVLLPKGNLASTTIADSFRKSGIMVEEWIVYETYLPQESKANLAELLESGDLDFAVFASPSAFRHFYDTVHVYGLDSKLDKIGMVSIGPVTSREITAAGLKVKVSPEQYTVPAMLEALCQYIKK